MNINTQEKTFVKYFLIFLECNWYFQLLRTRPVIEQRIHSTSLNASIRDKKLDRVTDNLYRAFSNCRSQNNLNRDEQKNVSYTVRKGRMTASYRAIFVNFRILRWTVLHFCSRVREQVQNHQSSTFCRTATTKTRGEDSSSVRRKSLLFLSKINSNETLLSYWQCFVWKVEVCFLWT